MPFQEITNFPCVNFTPSIGVKFTQCGVKLTFDHNFPPLRNFSCFLVFPCNTRHKLDHGTMTSSIRFSESGFRTLQSTVCSERHQNIEKRKMVLGTRLKISVPSKVSILSCFVLPTSSSVLFLSQNYPFLPPKKFYVTANVFKLVVKE